MCLTFLCTVTMEARKLSDTSILIRSRRTIVFYTKIYSYVRHAVTKEARELSEDMGVKIFTADIIYHLFDQFTDYLKKVGGWVGLVSVRGGWVGVLLTSV